MSEANIPILQYIVFRATIYCSIYCSYYLLYALIIGLIFDSLILFIEFNKKLREYTRNTPIRRIRCQNFETKFLTVIV